MPCACQLPFELYPDAAEWGPILWTLLHGLAERSGKPVVPMYAEDERRAWLHFFKQTGEIIPCPACKEHYNKYLEHHPIDALKTLPLSKLNDWVRTWFWEVHEWVNDTLGKPPFPKSDLTAKYGTVNLRKYFPTLEKPMSLAIMLSGHQNKKFMEWKGRYMMLLSILGL